MLAYYVKKTITTSYEGYGYFQRHNSSVRFEIMNKSKIKNSLISITTVFDNIYKNKFYYHWLLPYARKHFSDSEMKNLARQAFDPWFIYDEIKEELQIQQNQESTCFLSIIIPVFNTEPYLRRCLDSILNQNFISLN